jgi:small subunit ribosomal protein S20
MPRHKSAVKRVSTNKRDQDRNLAVKSELKTLLKRARQEPTNKELIKSVAAKLDRAVKKGVLHKAVANRRKSRIALMVNRTAKKAS